METIRLCKGCGAALAGAAPGGWCADCAAKTDRAAGRNATIALSPSQFAGGVGSTETSSEGGRRFGAYQLIRSLGQGGMGAVYEAEEAESGRRVALKVLSQALDSKDARQRFLREGRLAASVNHPNSVYIFGTEEVEGQPVITMELVAGGTLQERVRQKGPMPVTEAVEAMLNVIAGLEAAAAVGVLHRDVKPSNCFIEADGTVKIGDFGLSKSATGRAETEITMAESFLGTPAFSSPEQLRGDELTIASDIYAVGVTLYFVLTGRLPFESENMVRMLAMALEKAPDPPVKWRPELPAPLNGCVLKCLAKRPEHRFQNYAGLRRALAPFSKVAPSPATLSLRVAAGVADKLAVPVAGTVLYLAMVQLGFVNPEAATELWTGASVLLGGIVARILYFAIPEHLWGASPGKLVCDLRVVDASRAFPSWPKALARASIFTVVPLVPGAIYGVLVSGSENMISHPWQFGGNAFAITGLMFVAARRANGFAALHDWATGTRVIERSAYQESRPVAEKIEETTEAPAAAERFGVYAALEKLRETEEEEWILGLDAPLGRKVWIRRWKIPAPGVESGRRNLHRPGRLRWLNGRRGAAENWDAYEAPSGQPFLELIRKRQRWGDVRLWLFDLAQELDASLKDGSTPEYLSLDRLWITRSGHAKILDFAPPVAVEVLGKSEHQPPLIADDIGCRRFLRQAACSALEGRPLDCEEAHVGENATVPLPPHGGAFFRDLPDFLDLTEVAGRLRAMTLQPAAVSRQRRLLMFGACAAPVFSLIMFTAVMLLISDSLFAKFGDSAKLERCIQRWTELQNQPDAAAHAAEREALEVYISAAFRKAGVRTDADPLHFESKLNPEFARLQNEIKAHHPTPTPQELANAEITLAPLLQDRKPETKFTAEKERQLGRISGGAVILLPFFAILSAVILRRGLVARIARVEIITRDGAPARRWRLLCRGILVWGLLAAGASLFLVGQTMACWAVLLLFLGGVVGAIATPERTLADRMMGTWLAPE